MAFVYDLPLWLVGLVLMVVLCSFAAAGLRFTRRRILPRLQITEEDAHFSSTVVHSVMVFYALAVAMIAITVWETYDAAEQIVSSEATALATLYRNVGAYPPPAQEQLQDVLREYTASVIQEAWPEQHKGRVPEGGVERIDRFQRILTAFEPGSVGQQALHTETLRAYTHMVETRRMRLDAVQTALPGLLWTIIFIGAALGIAGSFFFHVRDECLHTFLVVLLTAFFAMVIFVVFAFDRPFRGDLGIKPEPYQLVYDQLMAR